MGGAAGMASRPPRVVGEGRRLHAWGMIGFNGIAVCGDLGSGNKRRAGRFRIEGPSCELGRIEDISSRGMRCQSRGVPTRKGQLVSVVLPSSEGPVEATVRLIWTRRFGLFKRCVGVEFVEAGEDVRRAALQLASASAANFRMKRVGAS